MLPVSAVISELLIAAFVVRSKITTATDAPTPTAPPPSAPLPMVINEVELEAKDRSPVSVISTSLIIASVRVVDLTTTPAPARPA